MIVIKIILIVLQFSFFVMCIENEGKELRFWTVLWLICAILIYAVRQRGVEYVCKSICSRRFRDNRIGDGSDFPVCLF